MSIKALRTEFSVYSVRSKHFTVQVQPPLGVFSPPALSRFVRLPWSVSAEGEHHDEMQCAHERAAGRKTGRGRGPHGHAEGNTDRGCGPGARGGGPAWLCRLKLRTPWARHFLSRDAADGSRSARHWSSSGLRCAALLAEPLRPGERRLDVRAMAVLPWLRAAVALAGRRLGASPWCSSLSACLPACLP